MFPLKLCCAFYEKCVRGTLQEAFVVIATVWYRYRYRITTVLISVQCFLIFLPRYIIKFFPVRTCLSCWSQKYFTYTSFGNKNRRAEFLALIKNLCFDLRKAGRNYVSCGLVALFPLFSALIIMYHVVPVPVLQSCSKTLVNIFYVTCTVCIRLILRIAKPQKCGNFPVCQVRPEIFHVKKFR